MNLLALDTSTSMGGVSIFKDSKPCIELNWVRQKSHTETVTAAIQECLNQANIQLGEIERLAVGMGPGSFTGIRIGINIIRTISYSLNIPICSFDTPHLLATNVTAFEGTIVAGINAFKNQIYYSIYQKDGSEFKRVKGPEADSLANIAEQIEEKALFVGDGFDVYKSQLDEDQIKKFIRINTESDFPLPSHLAKLSLDESSTTFDWKTLQPLYIRASEAEEKLKAGILKPLPKF